MDPDERQSVGRAERAEFEIAPEGLRRPVEKRDEGGPGVPDSFNDTRADGPMALGRSVSLALDLCPTEHGGWGPAARQLGAELVGDVDAEEVDQVSQRQPGEPA